MKKRIFIAIPISKKLQVNIAKWIKRSKIKIRWLDPAALHITLIPPIYIEESKIDAIKQKCGMMKNIIGPFSVNFANISFGPNKKAPHLIWASGHTPDSIVRLKNMLEETLKTKHEQRKFLLHLTIGRFKPEDFKHFKIKTINEKIDWNEDLTQFCIMESKLSKAGAVYSTLESFNI